MRSPSGSDQRTLPSPRASAVNVPPSDAAYSVCSSGDAVTCASIGPPTSRVQAIAGVEVVTRPADRCVWRESPWSIEVPRGTAPSCGGGPAPSPTGPPGFAPGGPDGETAVTDPREARPSARHLSATAVSTIATSTATTTTGTRLTGEPSADLGPRRLHASLGLARLVDADGVRCLGLAPTGEPADQRQACEPGAPWHRRLP